jgi:hypothetical protein
MTNRSREMEPEAAAGPSQGWASPAVATASRSAKKLGPSPTGISYGRAHDMELWMGCYGSIECWAAARRGYAPRSAAPRAAAWARA